MNRRQLFSWVAGLTFFTWSGTKASDKRKTQEMKIRMRSARESDDDKVTRASFSFAHGLALANADHDVQEQEATWPRLF